LQIFFPSFFWFRSRMEHTCEFCALPLLEINLTVQSPRFLHDIVPELQASELRVR
jgi:hypothetical protein